VVGQFLLNDSAKRRTIEGGQRGGLVKNLTSTVRSDRLWFSSARVGQAGLGGGGRLKQLELRPKSSYAEGGGACWSGE